MTAFDWFLLAFAWLGFGHVYFWRGVGNRDALDVAIKYHGRKLLIEASVFTVIFWPVFVYLARNDK